MEVIAAPLKCILEVKKSLECGDSLKLGLENYLEKNHDSFSKEIFELVGTLTSGRDLNLILRKQQNQFRRSIIETLISGYHGQAIVNRLTELEKEGVQQSEDEITTFVSTLPFRMMIPLLLFQFPAFLILLLGPIMKQFIMAVSK